MENIQIGLDDLIGGGIVAAILTGLFTMAHILLNKKVRTPADDETTKKNALDERNDLLARYERDLATAKSDIETLKTDLKAERERSDKQDDEIDILKSEALANEHYIYRCIGTIYRLGSAEDIPQPPPTRIKLTSSGDKRHG